MNTKKLCEKLTTHPDLKDIPLIYVFRVATVMLSIISSSECKGIDYELDIN